MVPGTAIGVLVGDLLFFWLAFVYARKTGKTDVTAMPLGLDTPSTIGMVLLVLGPAYTDAIDSGLDAQAAAMQTWHIGMCAILVSGLVKLVIVVLLELDSPCLPAGRIARFAGSHRVGVNCIHPDAGTGGQPDCWFCFAGHRVGNVGCPAEFAIQDSGGTWVRFWLAARSGTCWSGLSR